VLEDTESGICSPYIFHPSQSKITKEPQPADDPSFDPKRVNNDKHHRRRCSGSV
jgi:hypothetical protein